MFENYGEVRADKSAMKFPIISWQFDGDRHIFILKRQQGHVQFLKGIHDFSSLPRWDLNKLADLNMINFSNNSYADTFQEFLRKQKNLGWRTLKPRKARKMKLKVPDPTRRKRFSLKPHSSRTMTRLPARTKLKECLQNATG